MVDRASTDWRLLWSEEAVSEAIQGEIVNPTTPVVLTKHPEETVNLLEAAFHNAYNITEACQYAGISRPTFYEWLANDDGFAYRMSVAQGMINRKAKEVIVAGINEGDTGLALRYLMLKDPDFKPKVQQETSPVLEETRNKIRAFLDEPDDPSSESPAADSAEARGEVADSPADIS